MQLVQTVSRAGAGALRGGHQMVITSAGAGTGGLQLLSGAGSGANLLVGGSTGTPNLLVQSGTSANLQIVQPGQVNPIVGASTKLFLYLLCLCMIHSSCIGKIDKHAVTLWSEEKKLYGKVNISFTDSW